MRQLRRNEASSSTSDIYNPLALLRDFNRLFREDLLPKSMPVIFEAAAGWLPEVDIEDKGDSYYIQANLPGVDPKNVEVRLDKNTLTIRGNIEQEKTDEDKNYLRVERAYGEFSRSFYLPDIDPQAQIEAEYTNGVLHITLPKTKASMGRRIEIKGRDKEETKAIETGKEEAKTSAAEKGKTTENLNE